MVALHARLAPHLGGLASTPLLELFPQPGVPSDRVGPPLRPTAPHPPPPPTNPDQSQVTFQPGLILLSPASALPGLEISLSGQNTRFIPALE